LQEGEFERLGGSESIKVDVRVLAATNKNLANAVEAGEFREDLYWRLKIISITLPPLRDRAEDIPELAEYFLGRFKEEYRKSLRHLSEAALDRIGSHPWPGNVRELENCMKRAVLLCTGDVIQEEHIKLETEKEESLGPRNHEQLIDHLRNKLDDLIPDILKLSKRKAHANIIGLVEEMLISRALKECGNNQVKAARMLGISRNTLRHRMKKYDIKSRNNE
jgi:DNA-binding NtrC family response regulator